MSITISWTFDREDIADLFLEHTQEWRWIMDALDEDDDRAFEEFVTEKGGEEGVLYLVDNIVKELMRAFLQKMLDSGDLEFDGASPDATGSIGPDGVTVKNHSTVRVLLGATDDQGRDCSGMVGMIEEFNYSDIPATCFVQFPVDGKYEGEDIRRIRAYRLVPFKQKANDE